jgi:hypothetical protein
MFDWVPKFVVDFMSTKALTDATAWVKKFSEMEYEKQKKERSQQQLAIVSKSNKQGNSQGKKKKGFFENLMFWKHKAEAENERKRAQEEEAKKMAEAARLKEEEEARKKIFVSWTRLGMASAIFVFSIYNVHLKISS